MKTYPNISSDKQPDGIYFDPEVGGLVLRQGNWISDLTDMQVKAIEAYRARPTHSQTRWRR